MSEGLEMRPEKPSSSHGESSVLSGLHPSKLQLFKKTLQELDDQWAETSKSGYKPNNNSFLESTLDKYDQLVDSACNHLTASGDCLMDVQKQRYNNVAIMMNKGERNMSSPAPHLVRSAFKELLRATDWIQQHLNDSNTARNELQRSQIQHRDNFNKKMTASVQEQLQIFTTKLEKWEDQQRKGLHAAEKGRSSQFLQRTTDTAVSSKSRDQFTIFSEEAYGTFMKKLQEMINSISEDNEELMNLAANCNAEMKTATSKLVTKYQDQEHNILKAVIRILRSSAMSFNQAIDSVTKIHKRYSHKL